MIRQVRAYMYYTVGLLGLSHNIFMESYDNVSTLIAGSTSGHCKKLIELRLTTNRSGIKGKLIGEIGNKYVNKEQTNATVCVIFISFFTYQFPFFITSYLSSVNFDLQ